MYREPYERPSELVRLMGPVGRQKAIEREHQQVREEQRRRRAESAAQAVRSLRGVLVALVVGVLAIVVYNLLFGG
jgi:hypothetical protein